MINVLYIPPLVVVALLSYALALSRACGHLKKRGWVSGATADRIRHSATKEGYDKGYNHGVRHGRMLVRAPTLPEYTLQIGEAGDRYLKGCSLGVPVRLPGTFRWCDLWDVMRTAAAVPVVVPSVAPAINKAIDEACELKIHVHSRDTCGCAWCEELRKKYDCAAIDNLENGDDRDPG